MPKSQGGSDDPANLALACHRCNERRYNFTIGTDPETEETVPLFNPRNQLWSDHFIWITDSTRISGMTKSGRATCDRLDLNDDRYDEADSIRQTRLLWAQAGWHPPFEDPRQL